MNTWKLYFVFSTVGVLGLAPISCLVAQGIELEEITQALESPASGLSDLPDRPFHIADGACSPSGVTFNVASIGTDKLVFGTAFNSADWSGQLSAKQISKTRVGSPTLAEAELWEAAEVLNSRNLETDPRNIYTYNGTTASGIEFTSGNLSSFSQRMQDDLGFGDYPAEDRINYLRGRSIEDFRIRASLLGDIVNSTPVYVQRPSLPWPDNGRFGGPVSSKHYSDFRKNQTGRQGIVYVGANDGMLHAFAADDGEELFAYIPDFLASADDEQGLHYLTNPAYQHRYYVDLTPVVSDVYTKGANDSFSAWRTVLVGGGRNGGKGIFALDVTEPDSFSSGAASIPMWEFSANDDSRLGNIIEPPTIGLVDWGQGDERWTVFLPNGYLSETPTTGLFMLDIEGGLDGSWTEGVDYRFITFETGTSATGLSPVTQVDLDGDRVVDRVYAGDLKGNIWVAAQDSSEVWGDINGGALFTAVVDGNPQPITAAPMAIRYPEQKVVIESASQANGAGNDGVPKQQIMVLFGTGQYFEESDLGDTSTQSFYGVFDDQTGMIRAQLVERELKNSLVNVDGVDHQVRTSEGDAFDVSNHTGWYVDLPDVGERITQPAQVRGNYIFVNSLIPNTDPCESGGGGWVMAFALDGTMPDHAVWPRLENSYLGLKSEGGIPGRSAFVDDYALIPHSDGKIMSERIDVGLKPNKMGRKGWQELFD